MVLTVQAPVGPQVAFGTPFVDGLKAGSHEAIHVVPASLSAQLDHVKGSVELAGGLPGHVFLTGPAMHSRHSVGVSYHGQRPQYCSRVLYDVHFSPTCCYMLWLGPIVLDP